MCGPRRSRMRDRNPQLAEAQGTSSGTRQCGTPAPMACTHTHTLARMHGPVTWMPCLRLLTLGFLNAGFSGARHRCLWSQATFRVIRTLPINLQGGHRKAVPNPEYTNRTETEAPPQTLPDGTRENAWGLPSLASCHRICALNLRAGPIPREQTFYVHIQSRSHFGG